MHSSCYKMQTKPNEPKKLISISLSSDGDVKTCDPSLAQYWQANFSGAWRGGKSWVDILNTASSFKKRAEVSWQGRCLGWSCGSQAGICWFLLAKYLIGDFTHPGTEGNRGPTDDGVSLGFQRARMNFLRCGATSSSPLGPFLPWENWEQLQFSSSKACGDDDTV